ncbi:hypothetical protein QBC34DRAFT_211026 [Podospora aff. communis PSN243]|uniref:Heterokaryon incompatibility domain-containing protein n=1 Tax=Podospora aff. communis PSN243 TaxID=3040156 RepID=A0AAV9G7H7_9PEZI|nr:hypothetical protein QBC34DRAFT_211026 [Podospora aff. communis PSN243]
MRLIDTTTLRLVSKNDGDLPNYAILSHTWGSDDDEVSFQDLQDLSSSRVRQPNGPFAHRISKKPGFAKIKDSARLAKSQGFQYIWIDTCCINKTSSAELSEAINSMFRWYRNAAVCYAFLDDVSCESDPQYREFLAHFGKLHEFGYRSSLQSQPRILDGPGVVESLRFSRWFTRGWTLQELIAPFNVEFYSRDWRLLGTKLDNRRNTAPEHSFPVLISTITGIDLAILEGRLDLEDLSIASRMRWAARRQTTRIEDKAYCLMGIFGVNMPLLYGEGNRAFIRLQEEILKSTDDESIFVWQCPPSDPLRFQVSGLLALEPSYFSEANAKPLPRDTSRITAPFSMTNAGLHIHVLLMPANSTEGLPPTDEEIVDNDYLAILSCAPIRRGNDYYRVAVHLTSLGGDLYARISPETLAYIPSVTLTDTQAMDGWKYIYVKQPPSHSLPDIVLDPASFKASSDVYEKGDGVVTLVDCYPPQPFSDSLTFKPTTALRNSVLGAFRYRSPSRQDLQVDIFVGLVPGRQGSRQLWCAQQQVAGRTTLQRAAVQFDSSPFTKRGSQFQQDSHSFYDLSAQVKTSRSYSRTNIYLSLSYVTELPDMSYINDIESHPWVSRVQGKFVMYEELDGGEDPPPDKEQYAPDGLHWDRPSAETALRHLVEPLVVEDTFETGLGLTTQAVQQARIRVAQVRRRQLSQIINLAKRTEICLEKTQEMEPEGAEAVRIFHSLLLTKACIKEDVQAASELLASPLSGAIVEVQTCLKETSGLSLWHSFFRNFRPIHWAAILGHGDILPILAKHNADLFSTTGTQLTAAHLAVLTNNIGFLRRLFEICPSGWEEEVNLFETREPLAHLVAAYVKSEGVADILDHFMKTEELDGSRWWTNSWYNSLRETPLHRAAAMGNVAAVEAILTRATTSNIDPRDRRDRTPLWHACATGEHEVVELLLRHLADAEIRDADGMSALEAACRGGHAKTVQTLIQDGVDITGRIGQSINPSRITAIHLAAIAGDAETVRLLLEHGARPALVATFHQPESGSTSVLDPLLIAVANGWGACVKVLLEAGCSRDLPPHAELIAIPLVNDKSNHPRVSLIRSKSLVQVAEFYGRHSLAAHLRILAHTDRFGRRDVPIMQDGELELESETRSSTPVSRMTENESLHRGGGDEDLIKFDSDSDVSAGFSRVKVFEPE